MCSTSLNKFYVYCFFNCDWNEPFYIGKGSGNRYKNYNNRGKQISAILKNYNCESRIVFDNLTEEDAYEKEKALKEMLKSIGKPIVDSEVNSKSFNQRSGIEKKKNSDSWDDYGRPRAMDFDEFCNHYKRILNNEIKPFELIKELGLTKPTYYRYKKQYETINNMI